MKSVEEFSGPAVGLAADGSDLHAGTRHRVVSSILDHGPSTAAELAQRLDLTPAAVRRHLDCLVADGLVEARERRVSGPRGRGRPAKAFVLTDAGRTMFHQAYDQLALEAISYLGEVAGPAAIGAFARARVAELEERYRELLDAAAPDERARVLARALSQEGYAATAREFPAAGGEQLCQHHCPIARVAERFPQLCEEETRVFARLLGTHVQRLATIAHGDAVCTTYVPDPGSAALRATGPPGPGGGPAVRGPRRGDPATDRTTIDVHEPVTPPVGTAPEGPTV